MKQVFSLAFIITVVGLSGCVKTTVENRRDLYSQQKVQGPYTQMLKNGIPKAETEAPDDIEAQADTTDVSYSGK
ncbi:MAG: hypothetical protein ACK5LK_05700 [Chthoniobacterales bacterium]